MVWLTGALLGLCVVLVVGNTIRLDILNRRAEIEVMKLVGATDGFARRPFLYSGIWYGLGGGGGALSWSPLPWRSLAGRSISLASLYGSQFHLEGLRFGVGRSHPGVGDQPGLAGLVDCCDAAYPRDRAA